MDVIIGYLTLASYIFFGILVALFAIYIFNKPPYYYKNTQKDPDRDRNGYSIEVEPSLPKYMTEKSRYNFFLLAYVLISLGLYTLLGALLDKKLLGLMGLDPHPAASYLAAAVIIMGITSIDVDKYSWVKVLLIGEVRKWLHSYAKIPKKGQDIFYVLSDSNIDYKSSVAANFIDDLLKKNYLGGGGTRQDLGHEDFEIGHRDTIEWKWCRLSYCIHLIEEGNKQAAYKTLLNEASLGWHSIYGEYLELIPSVTKNKTKELLAKEQVTLNNKLKKLLSRTYRLISCVLLMISRPEEDPLSRLKRVGFDALPESRYFISSSEVVRVLAFVSLSIVVLSTLANVLTPITFRNQLVYLASAFSIFIVPIIVVVSVKKLLCPSGIWPIAKQEEEYERPVMVYLVTAAIAWLITTGFMMILGTVLVRLDYPDVDANNLFSSMLLYSSLSALTALFAAYRVDIPTRILKSKLNRALYHIGGGIIQGVATALLTWVCLMIDMYDGEIIPTGPLSVDEKDKLILYETLAFATGFTVFISLFFKKHQYEKRCEVRTKIDKSVEAFIAGVSENVTLKDISGHGVAFVMEKAKILETGTFVEILLDKNTPRSAVVVAQSKGTMHLSYI